MVERTRDGDAGVADLMEQGRSVLTRDQVMDGVPEMLHDILELTSVSISNSRGPGPHPQRGPGR